MDKVHHYLNTLHTQLRVLSLRRAGMSPKRDWYTLLVATALVGIVLLGVGVFQYHLSGRVVEDSMLSATSVDKLPDAEALAEAIGTYRERAVTFETLRATPRPAPTVSARVRVAEEAVVVEDDGAPAPAVADMPPVRAD